MSGFRAYRDFLVEDKHASGDVFTLSEDESRHLCGSLRARQGDSVDVFDLSGNVYSCRIVEVSQKRCVLEVEKKLGIAQSGVDVVLAQCLPKGKTFDEIIRQCVELGAAGIIPIVSEHSVFRVDADDMLRKAKKWEVKVIEAIKQSANFFSFKIFNPVSSEEFFSGEADKFDIKITASLQEGARPILDVLERSSAEGKLVKSACVLIGPEGDLSASEYARARECGFLPATLGKNVMKCDTAATCAISICEAFFNSQS